MSTKKQLFEKVFEKAKRERESEIKNALAKHLEQATNFSISSKTFSRYYDYLEKNEIEEKNISIDILNILANYIGYESFRDFNLEFKNIIIEENKTEKIKFNSFELNINVKVKISILRA
ncbi:hypothetical protein [Empedobacter brevis]|uniref:hypothetical protein n=1 Tax=Empedobacter brevis TaxID=247 RepID=UPI0039B01778